MGGRHKLFSLDDIATKLAPSPLLFGANAAVNLSKLWTRIKRSAPTRRSISRRSASARNIHPALMASGMMDDVLAELRGNLQ